MKEKSTQKIGVSIYKNLSNYGSFDNLRYGHLYCDFFIYDDDDPEHTSFYPDNGILNVKKLQISCQMDNHTKTSHGDDYWHTYAWRLEYNYHGVGLSEAEEIVKVLRMVDRKLKKYNEEWGNPANYLDYCQRIFKAIGVKAFRVQSGSNGGWYVYNKPGTAKWEMEKMLHQIKQTLDESRPKEES